MSDFYPWKKLDKQIEHLVRTCSTYDEILIESTSNKLNRLDDILKIICDRANTHGNIFRVTHQPALESVLKWGLVINNETGQPYSPHVFNMGQDMTKLVEVQQINVDICCQILEIVKKRLDFDDDEFSSKHVDYNFFLGVGDLLARSIEHIKKLPEKLHKEIASFLLSAFDHSFKNENGSFTLAHLTSLYLWFKLIHCIMNENEVHYYHLCTDRLYKLICDEDGQDLHSWWHTFWTLTALKYPNATIEHIPQFLHDALDLKEYVLLTILPKLYPLRPELFHERIDDIIHLVVDNNNQTAGYYSSLLITIINSHPELITSEQVDYLFSSIKNSSGSSNALHHVFSILSLVAEAQPNLFDKHRDELLLYVTEKQSQEAFSCLQQYLVASTIIKGEKSANENLDLLINLLKNVKNLSSDLTRQIFYACQLIGVQHKTILATKRNDLMEFQSNQVCRTLIDFIDGTKLTEENQAAINQTVEKIGQIEQRVVHTEDGLQQITKLVKRQELNVTNLNQRVNNADTRLNDLTEQVKYHAHEIERIDSKTLSYVPSEWGRDVCTLLNVRADNDWRLLGKRFGYSTSELKHWAMQSNPSMSLLNEWFMTHKADEATYGLLKMLNEINRSDVEQIIRKAVQAAGDIIPDDLPIEIKRCPPVFLSYQWGSQQAVLKLKTNLEQAGYSCWMDTGQMGGGDKLFSKIDAGIRGAKVVVCCMNQAYAQSDNCSREVHLTISTGKPLIPLQMEKQTWPPEGALGPIMSEYLYIRFYDRKSNDPNYWPADKFTELLGQIRYHVAPDPDMISNQYHNWFVPRVDNLIFLQSTNNNENQSLVENNTPLVVTHPQIMISYQWDYQKEIVNLYGKLTKFGYQCWLDIFQMGGGDSLFEKIDTGIRNAKCILSCVTPKYTKSINCRREMALADALAKPIVPLLVEETSTWPPSGPMAMVFAEKPYIDFRQLNDNNERWFGKQFESVLARLKQTIPEVQTEKPQRHLLDMKRPTTAVKRNEKKLERVKSAPTTPQSRACSLM